MARLIYGLPGNVVGKWRAQTSKIEFPMKTTRSSPAAGAESRALADANFCSQGQSFRRRSSSIAFCALIRAESRRGGEAFVVWARASVPAAPQIARKQVARMRFDMESSG